MTSAHREIEGAIQRLHCDNCGSVFHAFLFSGEEDGDTAGLCCAAVCNQKNIVVIVEMDASEWNEFAHGVFSSLEDRIRTQFNFRDLKVVRLLRVEPGSTSPGLSFEEFRKVYKPPSAIYSCVCCDVGEGRVYEEVAVKEFLSSGGRILLSEQLALKK
jgi:hypothetical protein